MKFSAIYIGEQWLLSTTKFLILFPRKVKHNEGIVAIQVQFLTLMDPIMYNLVTSNHSTTARYQISSNPNKFSNFKWITTNSSLALVIQSFDSNYNVLTTKCKIWSVSNFYWKHTQSCNTENRFRDCQINRHINFSLQLIIF